MASWLIRMVELSGWSMRGRWLICSGDHSSDRQRSTTARRAGSLAKLAGPGALRAGAGHLVGVVRPVGVAATVTGYLLRDGAVRTAQALGDAGRLSPAARPRGISSRSAEDKCRVERCQGQLAPPCHRNLAPPEPVAGPNLSSWPTATATGTWSIRIQVQRSGGPTRRGVLGSVVAPPGPMGSGRGRCFAVTAY